MALEGFIKKMYSIFFKWLQILVIVPKPGVSKNALFYTKVYGFIILHTLLLIHSIVYRMDVTSTHQLPVSLKQNIGYMEDLSELIIYSTYLVVMWSYCKNKRWQKFYSKLDGFSHETTDGKSSLVIFTMLIITNIFLALKVFLATNELYKKYGDMHLAATLVIYPTLQYYYVYCYAGLMLLTLLKVTWQVRKAKWTLNQKYTNLKEARAEFFKALTTAQFFNDVFGHPLLFMFGMWVFQIIGLLLKFVMLIKPSSKLDNLFENDLRPLWKTVVDLSGKVIFSSMAPCSVAFTCDLATRECEKLSSLCFQLQQDYNCRSSLYKELRSLGIFVTRDKIRFTAAEYFEVNRNVILSIIASSTTYFVALVQFY